MYTAVMFMTKDDVCEICEGDVEEFKDETEKKVVWGLMCKKCGHKKTGAKFQKRHKNED